MISFFRKALSSWLVLGLLGLVMIAFIITGVAGPGGAGGTPSGGGESIAKVGKESIGAGDIRRRAQSGLAQARQQNPTLDMATFVNAGGLDQTIGQYVAARALEFWARAQGLTASTKLVDGEIASIAAFNGPTGKFDPDVMRQVIAQQRLTEPMLREELAGDAIRRQLLIPVAGAARVPAGIVVPYASLLLEARTGLIGIVPSEAMPAGPPPTEAEVNAFYTKNIARFTIPERRVIRYALFGRDTAPPAAPGDAEIAAFYKANAATYGARETRTLQQIILPDQAAANAFVAKVRGGTAFVAAAQAAGFTPADITLGEIGRDALAKATSAAVATAAFAAPAGGLTAPVKGDLGWHVVKVEAVKPVAARLLESVRGEIAAGLVRQKTDEALANRVAAIEDAIADGSSFDDVVKSEKLTVQTTPPVLPDGSAPGAAGWRPAPELPLLLRHASEATADDDPVVETIGKGERYALVKVSQVVSATPAPLAQVRAGIVEQLTRVKASARAKAIAEAIAAKVKAGVAMPAAFAAAGVRLPAPQRAAARQIDLAQANREVPPPLALMFNMAPGDTRVLAAPQNGGWFVVNLATVVPGDARRQPGLIESTRTQFNRVLGDEYIEQFANAAAKQVGVTRDDKAIARLRAELAGGGAAAE
ncbi:peptidylprolyl isomerase [Sphingomonas solaris]|uniref:Parvulin-like PPIase n=1 Tax=Alterirhizorhabdus solaris TaxID=2529389 RepID=A0A558QU18_9SPHN|nr:peptidyl-prolyl cis-trans isomerase [Sphingomonas solaris]TVV70640.1 hypothetical protein FOY91_18630 [Sphingomonas solaris]